jgi:hypothetical protein
MHLLLEQRASLPQRSCVNYLQPAIRWSVENPKAIIADIRGPFRTLK